MFIAICILAAAFYGLRELARVESVQLFGEMRSHGPQDRPRVALTFDDGPSQPHTTEVLAMLAEQDAVATFFLIGEAIAKHPEASRAIAEAGHEIGNHSYTHARMVFRAPGFVRRELDQTDAAIRGLGYDGPIHFRAPYGNKLFVLPWVLARQNRLSVMWSLEGDGDLALQKDPAALAKHVVSQARAGDIILLHPMYSTRPGTRAALPAILTGLRDRGFELVTVSELLGKAPH
ncbi:putative polysaccharide deacetylase [Candidatus Rhodobacter oscarellae]|uniref:Chitooligosaccharide deacetylase n=1 Tax=Candidatus Rhodobacter oscarellae TaxID=1675527 RepID=A0A0J9EAJ9_9RHOB|nr:putative polysaccharide deacetylase [Candidatus Rhodobacter lobularis]